MVCLARGFTSNYQEAIALQRTESRPARAQRFGRGQLPFPTDICVMLMMLLDLSDVISCSRVSTHFRELSMDNRIWKPLYDAYFLAASLPKSASPFFRAHLGASAPSSLKVKISMNSELRNGHRESTDPTVVEGRDAANMFLVEMLNQRKKFESCFFSFFLSEESVRLQKQNLKFSIGYFQMFKRETNLLRQRFPTLVVDCEQRMLTIGMQDGIDEKTNAWNEKVSTREAVYWKQEYGDYHYR
jgi:hypothetical protein